MDDYVQRGYSSSKTLTLSPIGTSFLNGNPTPRQYMDPIISANKLAGDLSQCKCRADSISSHNVVRKMCWIRIGKPTYILVRYAYPGQACFARSSQHRQMAVVVATQAVHVGPYGKYTIRDIRAVVSDRPPIFSWEQGWLLVFLEPPSVY